MSSSTASSPSLSKYIASSPEAEEDAAAAACFNPLFIHTTNAAHTYNHIHKHNHNHSLHHKSSSNLSQNLSISNTNLSTAEYSSISSSKMIARTSPSSMQSGVDTAPITPSRKVHVVYYLSRSGQLEHPHLLEVSIPPNQGLYLRDVKRRLSVIRGKRLPSTFAWSYKRSYKNGYVWQDLCDDDLIFPAHGCEYVLKGSEILNDQRSTAEEDCGLTANADAGPGIRNTGTKEDQGLNCRDPKVGYYDDSVRAIGSAPPQVSMVESGTDAATQTEEEQRPATDDDLNNQAEVSKGLYTKHQGLAMKKQSSSFSPHGGSCIASSRPQNAVELNKAEIASPPSSSSATNSPSPYKEIASTSSSSTSDFNMASDCHSVGGDRVKPANPGSKTPGRPWMKKAIQKLEEQDEILCLHTASDNGVESGLDGLLPSTDIASSKVKYRSMGGNSVAAVIMEADSEQSLAAYVKPSRGKHSSALSLLQFMSCGGLDIKEQILPMSLYRLRSKGTPATANQLHMSNYVLSPEHSGAESFATYGSSESGKIWTKIGKPKSLCLNGSGSGSKPLFKMSGEFITGESDVRNQHGHRHYPQSLQANSLSPAANGSSAKASGLTSIPDVISIGRSSVSDRSTNVSHELDYQTIGDVHARLKKSVESVNNCNNLMRGSPRFLHARPDVLPHLHNNEGTRVGFGTLSGRAVSGEILMSKGSPLFVPGKRHLSYSGTPLNNVGNNIKPLAQLVSTNALPAHHEAGNNAMPAKQDTHNKSICSNSSCNPSRAFSDGEVSCMLANRNAWSKSGDQRLAAINGYDQSMAQLWEELLAAPTSAMSEEHHQKDADSQRVRQVTMGSSSAWEVERTLQNAVELSLQPPLEHHLLHVDCPHCGRKVKAELMKAHVKSCGSPKSPSAKSTNNCLMHNNLNSFGKSPKSDSNLCQRFLRASPPPTKL